MMKLLIITSRYPHIKDSVSLSFVKSQVDCLKDVVEKVYVVALTPFVPKFLSKLSFMDPRWKRDAFAHDYKYDNVEVYFAKHFTLPFDFSRKERGDAAFKVVNKIIQRGKIEFDLIHAHFVWSAGYVGAKLKEKCNIPFIVTAHGYDIYDLPFRDEEWKEKTEYVLNSADYIITVSNSNLECIKKLDVKTPVEVIPNGFRSDIFHQKKLEECKKKLNLPLDRRIILTVGVVYDEVKGCKYLIEAMCEVVKHKKDGVLCIIVGSGKLKDELENRIKELELGDYVRLVGGKPHQEIPIWMNACNVFVLPSLRESFGVVQIEAMACGKPVVATFNGGSEEIIINDKLGILVEPKDIDGLANAILKALDKEWDIDYILNCAEQYSGDVIAKKIIGVYNEVLKKE